jgi:hypothetical protein
LNSVLHKRTIRWIIAEDPTMLRDGCREHQDIDWNSAASA